MTRSSYALDGKLIKLTASTGSASKAFSGPSGTYNVQVYVLPENDGTPRLEFYKGATRIHSYTYPLGSGSTVSSYTINNVALTQGETIRLVGFANADAWARVDKIVFTPVGGSSTPPADVTVFAQRIFEIIPPLPRPVVPPAAASTAGVTSRTSSCSAPSIRKPSTSDSSTVTSASTAFDTRPARRSLSPNLISSVATVSFSLITGITFRPSSAANTFRTFR